MTTGIKGPTGPGGPTGSVGADDLPESDRADRADRSGPAAGAAGTEGAERTAGPDSTEPLRALAAELDSGRVSPEQALSQLLDDMAGELDPAERAELQGLFADLLTNDPFLAGLARDVGAAPPDGDDGNTGGDGDIRGG